MSDWLTEKLTGQIRELQDELAEAEEAIEQLKLEQDQIVTWGPADAGRLLFEELREARDEVEALREEVTQNALTMRSKEITITAEE